MPLVSELERIYRQTAACHEEAKKLGVAAMALIDPEEMILAGSSRGRGCGEGGQGRGARGAGESGGEHPLDEEMIV